MSEMSNTLDIWLPPSNTLHIGSAGGWWRRNIAHKQRKLRRVLRHICPRFTRFTGRGRSTFNFTTQTFVFYYYYATRLRFFAPCVDAEMECIWTDEKLLEILDKMSNVGRGAGR